MGKIAGELSGFDKKFALTACIRFFSAIPVRPIKGRRLLVVSLHVFVVPVGALVGWMRS